MTKPAFLAIINALLIIAIGSGRNAISVSSTAHAQTTAATLEGVVVDEDGAVVAGAGITILNQSKALERRAVTDDDGRFTFLLLPPDGYVIRAQRGGFAPVEIRDLKLGAGDHRAVRIQMKVGQVGETINIVEQASAIETASGGVTIDRRLLGNLPLNGRSLQSLAALLPGIVLTKATIDEQGQFSAGGQRANANYFTVDGVSANAGVTANFSLGQTGSGSLPALSATGGTNSLVSIDAVQEFKTQTGAYAPEFGRAAGALVSIVTRSGSNKFSGELFEHFRHEALDANDWFANRHGLGKAPLRQHDFGVAMGGPVLLPQVYDGRDRTFFFLSHESLRLRQPLFGATAVPSINARQAASLLAKPIAPILNAYPLPNGEELGNGLAMFSASYSDPTKLDAASIRIDHAINARGAIFARFSNAPSSLSQRTGNLSQSSVTEFNHRSLTIGATQSLASKINNDLRANYTVSAGRGFNRIDDFGGAVAPDDAAIFPGFASSRESLMLFFTLGLEPLAIGKNVDNRQRQINLVDHLSVTIGGAGPHQLKFGVDYRRLSPVNSPRAYDQAVNFSGVAGADGFPSPPGTLLSGKATSIQIATRDAVTLLFHNFSAYAQDTWRIAPRLDLTYGLRWEFNPPPGAIDGKDLYTVAGWDDLSTLRIAPRHTPLWQTSHANFAPRIAAAWRLPSGRGWERTLRAGFGVFHDSAMGAVAANASAFPYARNRSFFELSGVDYPLKPALAAPLPFSLDPPFGSFEVFDARLESPIVRQWSVAVEQALGTDQTLSAAYAGAAGRRLLRREALRNFNPDFIGPLFVTRNAAESDYQALQLHLRRRMARGAQALISYTWSHAIDTASNDSFPHAPADRRDPRLDRASSDFDVRQMLAGALVWQTPKMKAGAFDPIFNGWTIDTVFRAQTATPVNVTYARDLGFGVYSFRPDLTPGVPIFIHDPSAPGQRRINNAASEGREIQTGAFAQPAEARQGTLGRNALRGFPFRQIDFAAQREFGLTERTKLRLRAEVFNLLNHPNFADPRASLVDPLFGVSGSMLNRGLGTAGVNGGLNPIYQVGGARSIQLAVRLTF